MPNVTLMDHAKRLDPDGSIPVIANILEQTNEILTDMVVRQGNLTTGHRVTITAGLPEIYYRALNRGIPNSKATTVQVDENIAMAEARSEIDVDLVSLEDNEAEYRMTEAEHFIEGMNQTIATGIFYGNPALDPLQFLGLSQRYSDLNAGNAQNIIDGEGTVNGRLTSIWIVCWGDNSVFTIFPKGSKAGLMQQDLGEMTSFDAGAENLRMQVVAERFQWKIGLVVKDWRAVVRICNLDTNDFADLSNNFDPSNPSSVYKDLCHQIARGLARVPKKIRGRSRCAIYMNPSVYTVLLRTALEKSHQAVTIQTAMTQFGTPETWLSFLGVPIRQADAILNTEDRVT